MPEVVAIKGASVITVWAMLLFTRNMRLEMAWEEGELDSQAPVRRQHVTLCIEMYNFPIHQYSHSTQTRGSAISPWMVDGAD